MADKLNLLDDVWTRQPQSITGIDWSNPITVELTNYWHPLSLPPPPSRVVTTDGVGGKFDSRFLLLDNRPTTAGARSLLCVAAAPLGSNWKSASAFYTGSGYDADRALAINQTSANKWRVQTANGTAGFNVVSSASASGQVQTVVATFDGETLTGYVDGVSIGSTPASGGVPTANKWSIGGIGSAEFWNAPVLLVLQFNRALSVSEIRSLTKNPWQVFNPSQVPIYHRESFGPVDHESEGSVEGPLSAMTGSASHRPTSVEHETGGAPKGYQASVTGTAKRVRLFTSSGYIDGFDPTVIGTSTRYRMHPVTGVVVADYATVTGDAASSSPVGVHECEGIVVASEAIVVGAALNFSKLTSSGAVKGYQSTATGTARNIKKHSTNGAPIGKSSQVIGTAARLDPLVDHGTFGEVDGYTSTVTGNAVNQGAMTLTPADISAIVAALQAAILPVDIVRVNHIDVDGTGSPGDEWGPV